uniref:Uncharacterized protein n=1 Tax=Arundo donax TaxID=35708 RepID=A0A0A8ZIQ2_ARUDO
MAKEDRFSYVSILSKHPIVYAAFT